MSGESSVPMVEVSGLSKRVPSPGGELVLLDALEFSIFTGEALAITGASGSGKSTLLGLLAGLDMPTSGRIRIAGTDIVTLDEDGRAALRRGLIGFVFQSFQLLANLTALENVMLPLELVDSPDAAGQARALLVRVGLEARQVHYPRQLSGGEQQRVAIARAFALRPRLLFADEPTGNLDSATGSQVIELLFELNREQGATLVLVTHDEQLAGRCARRLRLQAGQLA